jgi:multidrug resistance efflux pump
MEGPAAPTLPADQQPTTSAAGPPRRRRTLKRSTRIALLVILVLALLAGAAFAISYFLNARNYVSTDNAQMDGDKIMINAPVSGTLEDWRIGVGSMVRKDEVVGRIKILGGFAQPLMSIRAPADGTVAVDNGVPGTFVTTGTQLAVAYNLDRVYVTARVDETDLNAVRVGQAVDVYVDAYPHARLAGRVREIQSGAAAEFSLFPQSNTSGNFQKVTQVIPVKISLINRGGLDLVPGMSVTVYIHKH